jgi:glycogen synthase
MRIAFPTTQYVTEPSFAGGLANYIHRVAVSLREMGHNPVVVVTADTTERFEHAGIEVNRIALPRRNRVFRLLRIGSGFRDPWTSHSLAFALQRLHSEAPFDIVQYPSYRALGLHRLSHIPAVVRLSSFRPLWHQELEADPTAPMQRRARDFELQAMKNADAVYAPSRFLAEKVAEATGIRVEAIAPPFVMDVKEEDPTLAERYAAQGRYLLFVGYLSTIKGIPDLAAVLGKLLAELPGVRFLFAGADRGCGEHSCAEHLLSAAGDYADRIEILGPIPHPSLYPLIRKAAAVVLPSRVDNLPNACLEAMALGQIVVGPDGASFDELIENDVSGILFEPGSHSGLLEAIHRALSLPEDRRLIMARAAVARIDSLRPERAIPSLLDFYRRVIVDFPARRRGPVG